MAATKSTKTIKDGAGNTFTGAVASEAAAVDIAAFTYIGNPVDESIVDPMPKTGGTVAATQSGTWTVQPGNTANTTAWKVDGSAVTQPVSLSGVSTAANQTVQQAPISPAAATATKSLLLGGQYNTALPVFTDGQQGLIPVDQNGALNTNFDGATFAPASVTSAVVIFTQDMTSYCSIGVQVTSAGSSSTITYETSEDNTNWVSVAGMQTTAGSTGAPASTSTSAVGMTFSKRLRYFRARVSTYGSGTITVVYGLYKTPAPIWTGLVAGQAGSGSNVSGNPVRMGYQGRTSNLSVTNAQTVDGVATLTGAHVVYPYSIPELSWNYAAASGGITNTSTAVTIIAAAGSGIRNYVTSVQLMSETLGAATEIAIRDGASGTVLWRTKINTGGTALTNVAFAIPLRGTANTLLEVVTLTATVTGSVYFDAQGYQAP